MQSRRSGTDHWSFWTSVLHLRVASQTSSSPSTPSLMANCSAAKSINGLRPIVRLAPLGSFRVFGSTSHSEAIYFITMISFVPERPIRRHHGHDACGWLRPDARSEEHTSELQSLMRISYAVFCLNKKTKSNPIQLAY